MGYRSPKLGEGFIPPPKQHGARAPAPQSGSARKCAKPRHLGASSPSGNVRGECRGWTPLDRGRKIVEWYRHDRGFSFSEFPPRRNRSPPAFIPQTPFYGRTKYKNKLVSVLPNPNSQKNSFGKTESEELALRIPSVSPLEKPDLARHHHTK